MSEWVKSKIDFGNRVKRLTLPYRFMVEFHGSRLPFKPSPEYEPDKLEELILSVLAEHRPEWKGGVLLAMRYDFAAMRWEVLYEHRSFPAIPPYSHIEAEELIPVADSPVTA